MNLRPATPEDAAPIAAIWNPYIRDTAITFTTEPKTEAGLAALFAERQAAGHPFLVAEAEGILGFASYAPFRSGPGYAHTMEHTVMLAPEARGRGAGSELIRALEQHARAAAHHSLIGGLSSENPGAIAFHAAKGFTEVGRIPEAGWKWGRWLDLILMQKRLGRV